MNSRIDRHKDCKMLVIGFYGHGIRKNCVVALKNKIFIKKFK